MFDAKVADVVSIPEVVVWDEDDKEPVTTTQNVIHMPLSMASLYTGGIIQPSAEPTTTTTMTSVSTQTVTVPAAATSTGAAVMGNASDLSGISYAPYRADHQCKSQADVDDDIARMSGKYSVIRVYGTDCDQVSMMYKAAKANNFKLFLGVWEPSAVEREANKIIAGVNGDWDIVHTVSVGNELVNNGQATPEDVMAAVKKARTILRAAGYQGPVVAVDTFMAVQAHPILCEESDYCAINAHAFFDSTTSASQAGTWLANTVKQVKSALSTPMRVVVTESGWPVNGVANGLAVPGLANQKMALDSIHEAFASNPGDVFLFSAYNDLWKTKTMATFNADQFWGINGAVAQCDQ